MTDPNPHDPTPRLDDLTAMLLGTDEHQPTESEPQETDEMDLMGDEFSRLQELLVKPDVQKMREHLARIERDFPALKARVDTLETDIQDLQGIQHRIEQLEQQMPELMVIKQQIDRFMATGSSRGVVQEPSRPFPTPTPDRSSVPLTPAGSESAPLPPQSSDTKTSLALVKLLMPIISSMLDRKLEALETRVIAAIQEHAGDAIAPPPSLSIRLSGLDSDPTESGL